jgi:hypothetical protein
MLPDPTHLQTTLHQDRLLAEAAANRAGRPHPDEPRRRSSRFPQLLRRSAGQPGAAAA